MEAALISPLGRTVIGTTKVTIGRMPDNTIVLHDAKASSHHAEIRPDGQYYNLVDLGSTNGTYLNEQQIASGVPRPLRTGDMVRIGETRFAFEVSSAQQGFAVSDGSTMRAMPPKPSSSALPNPGGNTNYGMGNANYGDSNYQPTIPAQPAAFTPPRTPFPDQQPSFTPIPPQMPYSSENQMPTYISPSYAQAGQQPSYTPQPGSYGSSSQFPTQQPPYTPPVQPPAQPPKSSPMRAIMLAVVALVVILAGVGGFFLYHTNQVNQEHANATATVQTTHNNATATALTQQNATATTVARINLTATAVATSPYSPFTKVALDDGLLTASSDWSASSTCQFNSTGFQASIAQANTIQHCLNAGRFGEMAYQVTMNITQGDCGGLDFRFVDSQNFYFFIVCQNGTYNVGDFVKGQSGTLYVENHASSLIQQGLNKPNVLAVTLQGNTINMYMNGKLLDNATNSLLTGSVFSQGSIGLFAEDESGPTTVTYTNALVWTM